MKSNAASAASQEKKPSVIECAKTEQVLHSLFPSLVLDGAGYNRLRRNGLSRNELHRAIERLVACDQARVAVRADSIVVEPVAPSPGEDARGGAA